ncbi:extracellular solute-binding protein [Actinoallomurus sp. CA-150999]|uniref:extracellular solute-binding protein n=1 Tax=Actinoallomurus sp. CA-150999 TaxID=3239887 RepID=UPI003D8AC6F5
MKVRYAAAGLAAALAISLSACGTGGPTRSGSGAGKSGGITVWAITGGYNDVYTNSVNAFESGAGQKANLQLFQSDAYKEKIRVSLGAGNPPEVFENWGGGGLKDLVKNGLVQDLTATVNGDPQLKSRFIPSLLDSATFDGKIYGVPMNGLSPAVVFYNKKIFTKYNLTPPKTFDDLLALAGTLKSHDVTPFALGGAQKWPELMFEEYLIDRIGGQDVVNKILSGAPNAWSDPSVVQASTLARRLVGEGGFQKGFAATSYDTGQATALLYTGKAAMELMGAWEYASIKKADPDMLKNGDLGWFAFPQVSGGKGDPSSLEGNPANYYSIAAKSAKPQVGVDYLKKAVMSPTYVDDLIKNGRTPPVPGIAGKLAAGPDGAWNSYVYGLAQKSAHYTLSWDQALPPATADTLLTNVSQLFLGKLSPQAFSAAMDKAAG